MLYIHGIGHFHPDNVIDNQFLTELDIGTNDEWIVERVGIHQRRTVLSLDYIRETYNKNPAVLGPALQYSNAQTGAKAACMALDAAKLLPTDIGLVIAGSCSPQYSLPAEACVIAAELNIQALAFDVNSACSTFAAHMHWLNQMEPTSLPDYILLVIPDNTTRTINYRDRSTAVLWGDGSAAIVVSKKIKSRWSVSHTVMSSSPSGWNKVTAPAGGHFSQEGSAVQKFAITKTVETVKKLRDISQLGSDRYYFIGHQANLPMLRSVCRMAGIEENKHLYNIDQYGNCGAAGAPSVVSQNQARFSEGDVILLAVVGAGLTWGGMVIGIN